MDQIGAKKANLPPKCDDLNIDGKPMSSPTAAGVENGVSEFEGEREISAAPAASVPEIDPTPRTLTYNAPTLMDDDIYEACMQYVQESCCYGSKFVKEMKLNEIDNGSAFHYVLESFGEMREYTTFCTPYTGQPIDGPENGPAPNPWDVFVPSPLPFLNAEARYEVPHTAHIRLCEGCCNGGGRVDCSSCLGSGWSACPICGGSGRPPTGAGSGRCGTCMSCGGSGRKSCFACSGGGQVKCKKCSGYGSLKICRLLIVTWTNHLDEFVSDTSNLPAKLVGQVTGNVMLYEEADSVMPIANAPDDSVNAASLRLIEKHRHSFIYERILKQRHTLSAVPITKALYQWKNKEGEFYVYGRERKVYFKNYPQKCCCCTCL